MSTKTFNSITEAVYESLYVRTNQRIKSEVTALKRLIKAQEVYEKIRL
jgi:hypothetical protein